MPPLVDGFCFFFSLGFLLGVTLSAWALERASLIGAPQGGREGGSPLPAEGAEPLTGTVTQFFSIQLRKDRSPPPLPPRTASPRELTAGTPELDMLLTVHLHVCKTLLQVWPRDVGGGAACREAGLGGGSPLCEDLSCRWWGARCKEESQ